MTTKTRTRRQKTEYEKKLSWLRNNKTPRHILEVELKSEENYIRRILSISDELRIIRNTVLGVVYKNYKQMKRTKKYNSLVSELSSINKQISSLKQDDENYDKDLKKLKKEKDLINLKLDNLKTEFNVTFDYTRKYGEFLREKKFKKVDAVLVWSACEVAWKSLEKVMYGNAKKPRFLKKGEYLPLQGKQATRCIILKCSSFSKEHVANGKARCSKQDKNKWFISHNKMKFDLKVNPKDLFIIETLSNIENYNNNSDKINKLLVEKYNLNKEIINTYRVCNNRIVIKEIRGKIRLYVQITIEGIPVSKRKKDGSFRHTCRIRELYESMCSYSNNKRKGLYRFRGCRRYIL